MNARANLSCILFSMLMGTAISQPAAETSTNPDSFHISTKPDALQYINNIAALDTSSYWPNIDPALFLENLKDYVRNPLSVYEGKVTNFCAFAALTYLPLHYDPLGYTKFMLDLFKNGEATMGKSHFSPGIEIRNAAGTLKFKGALDVSPAGQIWFLCLADHFKGYINLLNRKFDPGDENRLWASTNYAKFNRMIRNLFGFRVEARGSDLIRPSIDDLFDYIQEKLKTGTVFLYLNNRLLYNNKQGFASQMGIPTHFIVLFSIARVANKINIVYWDYGHKTLQQITPQFLHKIVFGVSHCTFP